ncbi:unnamed protein product [Blepharisma stoltei]|uniref:dual-specificity kinase n=1 Tax=Blepharisma stoltei TaxID=1481888 RepID=A0AAU9K0J5_9CILI|nr:unnamed protein product [Blepharisma stoltei]
MNNSMQSPRTRVSKQKILLPGSTIRKNLIPISTKIRNPTSKSMIQSELPTPKQQTPSNRKQEHFFPDKGSLNNTLNSPNVSTFKLNGSFNRSNVNLSRDEVRTAKPSPRASTIVRQKSASHSEITPDDLMASLQLPLTPPQVLKNFANFMSKYEQGEILDYPEVYYLGLKAQKTKPNAAGNNLGFDDDRSDYIHIIGDQIAYRYEILQVLGKGSFGQVLRCFDHKAKDYVALKIIRNQRRFHRQGRVEIKVLNHIRIHDKGGCSHSVIMQDYFLFRKHICITFELLNMNLYELLKNNKFSGFSLSLVRRFCLQIIQCLEFAASHRIIHCDLKPENILLKHQNKSSIKVIDFGSSCFEDEKLYTYIQSRFYRAPDIILGLPYTMAIDMWSLGCIAAELHSGCPLFPGESEAEQLLCIMEVKGVPPDSILERSTRKALFFEEDNTPKIAPNSRGKKRFPGTRNLNERVKSTDPEFLSFIQRCLDWNPDTRMTPQEALSHPWMIEVEKPKSRISSSTGSRGDGS